MHRGGRICFFRQGCRVRSQILDKPESSPERLSAALLQIAASRVLSRTVTGPSQLRGRQRGRRQIADGLAAENLHQLHHVEALRHLFRGLRRCLECARGTHVTPTAKTVSLPRGGSTSSRFASAASLQPAAPELAAVDLLNLPPEACWSGVTWAAHWARHCLFPSTTRATTSAYP